LELRKRVHQGCVDGRGAEARHATHPRGDLLEKRGAVLRLVQLVADELLLERCQRAGVALGGNEDLGFHDLNFAASASAPRARMPTSAPTATKRAPQPSQCLASASFGVRMPGAQPALRMRPMASSMSGFT